MIKKGKVPADIAKFGADVDHVFILAAKLKDKYGKDFDRIPAGSIGMVTYFDRLNAGLQQLMAGARKFALKYICRSDICALTRDAAEVSGIPYVMEADQEEVTKILGLEENGKDRSKLMNLNIEALIKSKALVAN
jgi:hypothetical protein